MSTTAIKEPFKFVCNPIKSVKDFKVSKSTLTFPDYSEDFQYDIVWIKFQVLLSKI